MERDNRDCSREGLGSMGSGKEPPSHMPESSRSLNLGEINGKCFGRISLKWSRHTIKSQVAGGGGREIPALLKEPE